MWWKDPIRASAISLLLLAVSAIGLAAYGYKELARLLDAVMLPLGLAFAIAGYFRSRSKPPAP